MKNFLLAGASALMLFAPVAALADEGMWLPSQTGAIADAMKKHGAAAGHGDTSVSGPHLAAPLDRWPVGGPGLREPLIGGCDAVAIRTEHLRPVAAAG